MATLKAMAEAEGRVRIELDSAAGVSAVLRSDSNGTRRVRTTAGQFDGDGPKAFFDYEAALSGPVMYRLTGAGTPAWVEGVAQGDSSPRFVLPHRPAAASVAVQCITAYDAERASRSVFHEVIDREDPMVALGALASRVGSMTAVCTHREAGDLEELLRSGDPVMFRQTENPGQDMYFHAETFRLLAVPEQDEWEVQIRFREIEWPDGFIVRRAGWTFDAVAAVHPSFDSLTEQFRSFRSLSAGRN